ncbi:peptidoglycan synthetase [Poseidonibacter antarcticus]|uniref:peptidoglycan synthetase n=1 Tax=Poseidonibacter antarcticus TaxID=2478538 RepID=UPI000EF53666|nr:peptidoglycan synthetase [Poseidonibacter antarcticus]
MKINSIIDIIDGKLLNSPSISFIYSFKTDVNKVKEGDLFIANNLDDIQIAVQKGAFAIITKSIYPIIDNEIAWIKVDDINTIIIKLIRYKLANFNLKAYFCNDISYELLTVFSSNEKKVKLISKDLGKFISTIDEIDGNSIIISKDIDLLNKLYPNNTNFEKENFSITNLIEHSIFEVSFTYKDTYFQRIKIPSIYIEDFIRVYNFLSLNEFDDSKLKNFNFFKPIFLDKNLTIIEFGKSNKFIIVQNEPSLINKEINYLKDKFSYAKTVYITSTYIKNISVEQIIVKDINKIKNVIENQSFNALYISGFKFEDIQQILLKKEKELSLF